MTFESIKTIRYMGTKSKLLEFIVPNILSFVNANDTVVDLMAGSYAVSYALKPYCNLICNDIQKYSETIGIGLIENQHYSISSDKASLTILPAYKFNKSNPHYTLFKDKYSNTYFSSTQCFDIDCLRYAIDKIENKYERSLYLCALMNAMCKVQSTPGHFAQYMPNTNKRIIALQKMNLLQEFLTACDFYKTINFSNFVNKIYCEDYNNLLKKQCFDSAKVIYMDPPYTCEQYSRFYHVLETVIKYDYPQTSFKAKYRQDRFMSSFCYKTKVENEFNNIFNYCKLYKKILIISYSDKSVLCIDKLCTLAKLFFSKVDLQYHNYYHSTQGKGHSKVNEIIVKCYF